VARKRRPAAETKAEIVEVARRQVAASGPAELRLDDVAREVGVSRQAILHHFGSREGLLREVVGQAWLGLFGDLRGLAEGEPGRPELIERVDEVTRTGGNARLGAWLLLSDKGLPPELFQGALADLPGRLDPDCPARDAQFQLLLVGAALFGDAIFGERLRQALGMPDDEAARADFRAWLGERLG
jgi:AcrR family transcriptional regulator